MLAVEPELIDSSTDNEGLIHIYYLEEYPRALCGFIHKNYSSPWLPLVKGPNDCETCWFLSNLANELEELDETI